MTASQLELPALYKGSDEGAAVAQSQFLWTIRLEYFLLVCAAVGGSLRDLVGLSPILLTFLLFTLSAIYVFRTHKKLDQDWYQCRALAESVKTLAWRFSMRAHPFENAAKVDQPKAEFLNQLQDILKANRHIAESVRYVDAEQVTASMLEVRQLPLLERINYYVKNRINDQRNWYSQKSNANRRFFRIWVVFTIFAYVVAAVSLNGNLLGLQYAEYIFDPMIVVVTSAIGWLQMKRHSELTARYNLTAYEIGIIRSNSAPLNTEEQFSEFVNEAELAFSREHTQWIARRNVK